MKKVLCSIIFLLFICLTLIGCAFNNNQKIVITKEIAYEGVNNYCHEKYDWSIAKDDPSIMYVEMADETDSEYQITFRSYTGSFVYFYVNKDSGLTKIIEYVPNLDIKNELESINILDYIDKNK